MLKPKGVCVHTALPSILQRLTAFLFVTGEYGGEGGGGGGGGAYQYGRPFTGSPTLSTMTSNNSPAPTRE